MFRISGFALTLAAAGLFVAGPALAQYGKPDQSSKSRRSAQTSDQSQSSAQSQSSSASSMKGQLTASDRKFLSEAAQADLAEVQMGKLAQDKGSAQAVKDLGKKIEDDHNKSLDQLKSIAQNKSVTLPDQPDAKHKAEYDRLSKLSGDQFDRAFLKHEEADHKKDIAMFQRESERASDPDVKSFAGNSISTLQEHERMAHDAIAGMPGTSGSMPRTDEGTTKTKTKKKSTTEEQKEQKENPPQQQNPPQQ